MQLGVDQAGNVSAKDGLMITEADAIRLLLRKIAEKMENAELGRLITRFLSKAEVRILFLTVKFFA
jgi:hypothetical protein